MNKTERRVKIVCTMGPACWDHDMVTRLAEAGMNVARFNFSHGDYESHGRALETVRSVSSETGRVIASLLDTKGPEIRTGLLAGHKHVMLAQGSKFTLELSECEGNASRVFIDYAKLPREIKAGQDIYIDDGSIRLTAENITQNSIVCSVAVGGELGERKGVNVPGANLSVPTLTDKDISDIRWGVEHGMDFIAVSFVRSAEDIDKVRGVMDRCGGGMKVIAKIETAQAVKNFSSILEVSDGVMIARGDLGVEIPTEDVPVVQKKIIETCRSRGKFVIVATQMLDSMIRNPKPTRAEASDVANAVIDGTDAVMLSGETAGGKYPLESVVMMSKIAARAEQAARELGKNPDSFADVSRTSDAVSHAAEMIAENIKASAIISLTRSGSTACMVSKYRPECRVIGLTPSQATCRFLSVVWGVEPYVCPFSNDMVATITEAVKLLKKNGTVADGDNIVITSGLPLGVAGSTNSVHVYTVGSRGIITEGTAPCRS